MKPYINIYGQANSFHPFMKLRFEKENRYYTLRVYQDLLGDWIVERSYGSKQTRHSQVRCDVCAGRRAARQHFIQVARFRIHRRHYERVTAV